MLIAPVPKPLVAPTIVSPTYILGNCKDDNLEKSKSEDSDIEDDDETKPRLMSVAVSFPPDQSELESKLGQDLRRPQPVLKESNNVELKLDTTWEIESIPPASSDYRRSRTVIEVPGRSMHEIARIIFASNKAKSIHAVYDNAIVKCKTSSYLKFTVRLLYSPKDADSILVDVRRVSGCALAFRDEYQAIVHAILPDESTPRKMHGSVIKSFADLESMDIPDIPVDEDIIERSLEDSIGNLESKMYDTRIITLQDLLLTTGPESKETSSTACKLILGNSKYNKILEYVVRDIMKKVENTGIDDNDSEEYQRSLTLNILGNLLSSENNSTLKLIKESPWTGKLIDILIWYVDMHRKYPWNACLAAKCLRLFASNDSAQQAYHGVYSALEDARCYGNISYDLLEKEAKEAQLVFDMKV